MEYLYISLLAAFSLVSGDDCCKKLGKVKSMIEETEGILLKIKGQLSKERVGHVLTDAVAFHARLSQHVTLGTKQTVIFDDVITTIGNGYNPHTGHFTAPADGVYYFVASFLKTSSGPELHLQMAKNDSEISSGYSSVGGSETGTMSAVIYLKKGDLVKVRHYPTAADGQIIHGGWSYFTGYRIK